MLTKRSHVLADFKSYVQNNAVSVTLFYFFNLFLFFKLDLIIRLELLEFFLPIPNFLSDFCWK